MDILPGSIIFIFVESPVFPLYDSFGFSRKSPMHGFTLSPHRKNPRPDSWVRHAAFTASSTGRNHHVTSQLENRNEEAIVLH